MQVVGCIFPTRRKWIPNSSHHNYFYHLFFTFLYFGNTPRPPPPPFFYLLKFTLLVSLRSKGKRWQIDRNSPLLCLQLVEASQTLSFPKNQCFFTCWCSLCRQAELVLRTFWDRINICQQKPLREKHLPTEIRRANVKWVINSTAHSPQRINYKRWWPDFL